MCELLGKMLFVLMLAVGPTRSVTAEVWSQWDFSKPAVMYDLVQDGFEVRTVFIGGNVQT